MYRTQRECTVYVDSYIIRHDFSFCYADAQQIRKDQAAFGRFPIESSFCAKPDWYPGDSRHMLRSIAF